MKYIINGFSAQMLRNQNALVRFTEINESTFKKLSYDAQSIIGHKDLANLLKVEYNRESIKLNPEDVCLLVQIQGGRLPEGTTTMPDNVELKYHCIKILE